MSHKWIREILVDGEQQYRWAWEHDDMSTNVAAYLTCYAIDDNVYYLASTGHAKNVLDELIEYRAGRMDFDATRPQCSVLSARHVCECGDWIILSGGS